MLVRELQEKDAPFMHEWMQDKKVVEFMYANFMDKTLDDCVNFILGSQKDSANLHLAVADDKDEYMGTVSLKNINNEDKAAEFAITFRRCAMKKGYAAFGTKEIIKKGLNEMGLKAIYWCVLKQNKRAIRFYDKNGYTRTQEVPDSIRNAYTEEQLDEFIWYAVSR